MVAALGGPNDLVDNPAAHLRSAAVTQPIEAERNGFVHAIDTRNVGLAVVALGGGRMRVGDAIDHTVGLSDIAGLGEPVDRDHPIAIVHARSESEATIAADAVRAAFVIGDVAPPHSPVVASRITG
jgi:thymidine phosphorylase